MKRLVILLASTLALGSSLGGCASMVTPYQPQGLRGGYVDHKLADDRFSVDFSGNGFAILEMAQDFAVMRGAELCLTAGFAYVSVVGSSSRMERTYSYTQYGGSIPIDYPIAHVEVLCSHEGGPGARATADVIAQTHAAWPNARFKAPKPAAAGA